MTAYEHLLWAVDELDKIRPAPSGTYELVVSDDRIVIRPYSRNQKPMPLLIRLSSIEVNKRIAPHKWDNVINRIRRFIERGILE